MYQGIRVEEELGGLMMLSGILLLRSRKISERGRVIQEV
jgi:hypothetical protein